MTPKAQKPAFVERFDAKRCRGYQLAAVRLGEDHRQRIRPKADRRQAEGARRTGSKAFDMTGRLGWLERITGSGSDRRRTGGRPKAKGGQDQRRSAFRAVSVCWRGSPAGGRGLSLWWSAWSLTVVCGFAGKKHGENLLHGCRQVNQIQNLEKRKTEIALTRFKFDYSQKRFVGGLPFRTRLLWRHNARRKNAACHSAVIHKSQALHLLCR